MDKEVESLGNIEIIEGDEEEGDDDDVDMDEEEQDTNGKVGTGLGIIEIVCGSDFLFFLLLAPAPWAKNMRLLAALAPHTGQDNIKTTLEISCHIQDIYFERSCTLNTYCVPIDIGVYKKDFQIAA